MRTPTFLCALFIVSAWPVGQVSGQAVGAKALPVVISADVPLYPRMAQIARIQGTVTLQIETDGTSVKNVTTRGESPILRNAAEANVRTWRFRPDQAATFTVTFEYIVDRKIPMGSENSVVVLKLPTAVEIRASEPQIETDPSETRPR